MQVSIKKAKVTQKEYFCLIFTLMTWTCSQLNNFLGFYLFYLMSFNIKQMKKMFLIVIMICLCKVKTHNDTISFFKRSFNNFVKNKCTFFEVCFFKKVKYFKN